MIKASGEPKGVALLLKTPLLSLGDSGWLQAQTFNPRRELLSVWGGDTALESSGASRAGPSWHLVPGWTRQSARPSWGGVPLGTLIPPRSHFPESSSWAQQGQAHNRCSKTCLWHWIEFVHQINPFSLFLYSAASLVKKKKKKKFTKKWRETYGKIRNIKATHKRDQLHKKKDELQIYRFLSPK